MSNIEPLPEAAQVECENCGGQGILLLRLKYEPEPRREVCGWCHGTGSVPEPTAERCDLCGAEEACGQVEGIRVGPLCLDQVDLERRSYDGRRVA